MPPPSPLPRPQTTTTEAHVRQALELFKNSTMDAVKSGLMEVAVFTDEQRWVGRPGLVGYYLVQPRLRARPRAAGSGSGVREAAARAGSATCSRRVLPPSPPSNSIR